MGSEERRDADKRVGQSRIREKIARNGRDFVRERKLAGDVGGTTDRQNRAVRESKRQARQRLGREKGAERGEVAKLQEHTCAACVCNERREGRGWWGNSGDGRVRREMRSCRREGAGGARNINRGRGFCLVEEWCDVCGLGVEDCVVRGKMENEGLGGFRK